MKAYKFLKLLNVKGLAPIIFIVLTFIWLKSANLINSKLGDVHHSYLPIVDSDKELYGNPWQGDGLANISVGKEDQFSQYGHQVSHRFIAKHSGTISSIILYWIVAENYATGNRGRFTFEIRENDPSCYDANDPIDPQNPIGCPSEDPDSIIAVSSHNIPCPNSYPRKIEADELAENCFLPGGGYWTIGETDGTNPFIHESEIQAGKIYHLVMYNTAPNPGENHSSVDHLNKLDGLEPIQLPEAVGPELHVLVNFVGTWETHFRTPIQLITYTSGQSEGQVYSETPIAQTPLVAGSNQLRQRFTVSGRTKFVDNLCLRFAREGDAAGELLVRLEKEIEDNIEMIFQDTVLVNPSLTTTTQNWYCHQFNDTFALENGQTYRLVISSPESEDPNGYFFHILHWFRNGYNVFTDGKAEKCLGVACQWQDTTVGYGNDQANDLSFFFSKK